MRITPAGAGKTVMVFTEGTDIPDHPRRCGENALAKSTRIFSPGSPPQVRGKPTDINVSRKERGITPAGAGKTEIDVIQSFKL